MRRNSAYSFGCVYFAPCGCVSVLSPHVLSRGEGECQKQRAAAQDLVPEMVSGDCEQQVPEMGAMVLSLLMPEVGVYMSPSKTRLFGSFRGMQRDFGCAEGISTKAVLSVEPRRHRCKGIESLRPQDTGFRAHCEISSSASREASC